MRNCKQGKYKLLLCFTLSIVLISSFCSTIFVFAAQSHQPSSFGPISSDIKFDFKRVIFTNSKPQLYSNFSA